MIDFEDYRESIERGPAKYFHGRHQELKAFKGLLHETSQKGIGSSLLIQGPPGVGKTALIEEHKKEASLQGWQVVDLTIPSLYDPKELFRRLTKNQKAHDVQTTFGVDLKIFKVGFVPKHIEETPYLNEAIIRSQPTCLVLDEAQTLDLIVSEKDRDKVADFFRTYHNVLSEKGFVFLFGGLSTTKDVLRQFGISRFNTNCIHYLEPIERDAERSIIDDWLTKEIKTPSDTTSWIDQITQRTDRWPRHIQSYSNAICDFLEPKESLTHHTLKQVLAYGDDLKLQYYEQRCDGISYQNRQLITSAMESLPPCFDQEDFISCLSKRLSKEDARMLYETILSKGIIHIDQRGISSVPIPSFRSFLIEEYGQEDPKTPPFSSGLALE
ncbi:MAG: ATP-binding protein [Flavobacteriaceae bacterium]|nr:ATP-binding protein [Flavobacteriaceae bacterium]